MGGSAEGNASVGRRNVHFLTLKDPLEVCTWSPAGEPARFATGEGHQLLELFVRLRDRGAPVTVGRHAPRGTSLVVVSLARLARPTGQTRPVGRALLGLAAARTGQAVVIRGDYPLAVAPPAYVRSQVAPTHAAAGKGHGTWLPFLPQRGMRPRAPERRGQVRSLGLMAYEWSVPEYVADGSLAAALAPLGIDVIVRADPAQWPEFHDLDAVLCARRPSPEDDDVFTRKPVTKLVNAWVAGCVPLVHPEAGYLEVGHDGVDLMVVRSVDDVAAALTRLQQEPHLLAQLEAAVRARAVEFTVDRVLDQWEQFLWETPHPITSRPAAAVDVVRTFAERVASRARRVLSRGVGGARHA